MKHLSAKVGLAASSTLVHYLSQWSPSRCDTKSRRGVLHGTDGPDLPVSNANQRYTLESACRCVSAKRPRTCMAEPVRHDCGEDAFFMAAPSEKQFAVGIADGVSSWARIGVDSAFFAWDLMNCCENAAARAADTSPRNILQSGYAEMRGRRVGVPIGSSTACVASLDRFNGNLQVANLGDSGALVFRNCSDSACGVSAGKLNLVLATKEQVHAFNCPYQLMLNRQGAGAQEGDQPSESDDYRVEAADGDLLILGTDGFFDNVWRERILEIASERWADAPANIAEVLVQTAYANSTSDATVPFGLAARRAGYAHRGGKPDDITVLVARIRVNPNTLQPAELCRTSFWRRAVGQE